MIKALLLGLNALMFIGFGLGFILVPETVTPLFLGVPAPQGDLLVDMQATYGGLSLAAGLYMARCAIIRQFLVQGLLVAFLVAACVLVGRIAGVQGAIDPGPAMYQSLWLEVVLTILFGGLYLSGRRGGE